MRKKKSTILQAIGKQIEAFGRWLQTGRKAKAAAVAAPAKRKAGRPRKAQPQPMQTPLPEIQAGDEV